MRRRNKSWAALGGLLLVAILGWAQNRDVSPTANSENFITHLYDAKQSGEMVEGEGIVQELLADDLRGAKHQRFILRLSSGHTLLVSHNIDLAPRVDDLKLGDTVRFRGQYEWNARGGVVHWTHRDPRDEHQDGWLEHAGKTYH